eukprot:2335047-Rhodomonas_salina.1
MTLGLTTELPFEVCEGFVCFLGLGYPKSNARKPLLAWLGSPKATARNALWGEACFLGWCFAVKRDQR